MAMWPAQALSDEVQDGAREANALRRQLSTLVLDIGELHERCEAAEAAAASAEAAARRRSRERSASVEMVGTVDEGTLLPPLPAAEEEPGRARPVDEGEGARCAGVAEARRVTPNAGTVVEGGDGEAAGPLAGVRIGGLYHASNAKKVCECPPAERGAAHTAAALPQLT
jgi:hypothetical protein